MSSDRLNVLQLVGFLGRGGDTTAVLNAMRRIPDDEIHFDFITHRGADFATIKALVDEGHKVQVLGGDVRALRLGYPRAFANALKGMGVEYDVIHAHTSMQSGIALRVAKQLGIGKRICHSHVGAIQRKTTVTQRMLLEKPLRRLYLENSTTLVACSRVAGDFLFGNRGYEIVYNGVDVDGYSRVPQEQSDKIRIEFGCGSETILIGQVAHFSDPKNQAFTLDVAASFLGNPRYRFALVGSGSDFEAIVAQAEEMDLDNVVFPGQRGDMRQVMAALDCLILPSLPGEGFPMTILEAVAAGASCIASTNITEEIGMLGDMVQRIDLSVDAWHAAISSMSRKDAERRLRGRGAIVANKLDLDSFARQWAHLYR